jgi:hypothetical protein
MALPDLGLFIAEQTPDLPDMVFMNCQVIGVMSDKPGYAHVVFTIWLEKKFMGSLLIKEKPSKIARRLAIHNNQFGFRAKLAKSERYVDRQGLTVVPFYLKGKLLF